jgi:hypothetical protein
MRHFRAYSAFGGNGRVRATRGGNARLDSRLRGDVGEGAARGDGQGGRTQRSLHSAAAKPTEHLILVG